jgi:hypothetical protein
MAASNTRFTQNSLGQSKNPIDSDHGILRYSGASSSRLLGGAAAASITAAPSTARAAAGCRSPPPRRQRDGDVLDSAGNELRRIVARRALHHGADNLRVPHRVPRTEHAVDLLPGKLQSRNRIAHAPPGEGPPRQ